MHRAHRIPNPMLDVPDVAERLGVSVKAVRGLIARGELAAYKVAGRIRIDPADLEDYLGASRVRPSPPPTVPSVLEVPAATGSLRALLRSQPATRGARPKSA